MVAMSMERRSDALVELAEAIRSMHVPVPGAPSILRASVEPYQDADGEASLRAVLVVEAPDNNGWPADFTHALRRQVNRLAAERHIDEHVYVTLFSQEEFEARDDTDEPAEDNTSVIDRTLTQDQQDWS